MFSVLTMMFVFEFWPTLVLSLLPHTECRVLGNETFWNRSYHLFRQIAATPILEAYILYDNLE